MTDHIPTPQEVGLPHEDWRKAQLDAFLGLRTSYHDGLRKFHFAQIPTGGGKTGIAAALGSVAPVTYVAGTLGLLDQAEREYGFIPIKGRQEYDCAHPKKLQRWSVKYGEIPTARDCHLDRMTECPYAKDCGYILQKHAALGAQRAACTYPYLALSKMMRMRGGILVLDECHAIVSEIISLASFEVNEWTVNKWNLPAIPWRRPIGPRGRGDLMDPVTRSKFVTWAAGAQDVLTRHDPETKEGIQAKRLRDKIRLQLERMAGSEWFIEAGPAVVTRHVKGKRIRMEGIVLRPLSAEPVAKRLWGAKDMVLLMSATIGADPSPLAKELGIDQWAFLDYPHPIPPAARPVYDLGLPRMTKANLDKIPGLLVTQAIVISQFIESLPSEWRGLVLTSSLHKIEILRKVLKARLQERIFEPPGEDHNTTAAISSFMANQDKGKILIGTVQGLGHGISLYGDAGRFVVLAGVPFPNPSDPFVNARRKLSDGFLWWESYNNIPQAVGRVSRGEILDNGDFMLNVGVIADGSAMSPRAKRHFPSWFRPIKWRGKPIDAA